MGLLGGLLRLGVDVVKLPLSVIDDVGNTLSGQPIDSTTDNIKEIIDDVV